MNIFIELIPSGLTQGLILALVALGVMIPFKILNFPDMTSEGSYPLGGAVYAALASMQFGPIESCIVASMIAGFVGICTAMLHLRLKINTLLAGIIISTMVYSVNLRLMGKPNIALFEYENLFSMLEISDISLKILSILLINMIIIIPFMMFLYTETGLRFRAVGANPIFAEKQGISITQYTILGLFVGNGLCGFAGSLMVQMQGYADIGMGVGIVASMAMDAEVDKDLVVIRAEHLFAPHTSWIGFRRGRLLRGYMYDFLKTFAPHLTRRLVDQAVRAGSGTELAALFSDVTLPNL